MKDQILKTIYTIFTNWSQDRETACQKGCATCCTQNVTITALEGEIILRFIRESNMAEWLGKKLQANRPQVRVKMTTNDFARACLKAKEIEPVELSNQNTCPFLEQNICRIYPARPFGCRMLISQASCAVDKPALLPEHYFAASTSVAQIVEHLGQKEYWGNMLDVLPALCDMSEYSEIAEHLSTTLMMQSRMQTLTAKPLPGFLFSEEEEKTVAPLLQTIFAAKIEGRRIEDILNGR